jgi:hypothetical protein
MAERGQLTLEGILIMGFFIIIFLGISFPAMLQVHQASNDAVIVLEGRTNLDKISSSIMITRANGPGSVRIVTVKSSSLNWSISSYDDDAQNNTLTYWVEWNSPDAVPAELIKDDSLGGIGKNSIAGVSTDGTESTSGSLEAGSYTVKVENIATSNLPNIDISTSGNTVLIKLVD